MNPVLFDFHFELAGRSGSQGAIAPAEQFFEGSMAEVSLAREIGQNSIDARAGEEPVLIRFELAHVLTDEIPGIETLRSHLAFVVEETEGSQGHDRMVAALDESKRFKTSVLRISDYGTTGLEGAESKNDNKSALSALTRGAGISANDGRGGSFGIGSAVGPMSSSLCTVLYTSLPVGQKDVIFAGHSRLASHRDAKGDWRNAEGFFTDVHFEEDFRYLRNPPPLKPFDKRVEPGTDIYVLGYRKAMEDPGLDHIKRAFLSHFLVAIYRGHLIVEGVGGGVTWRIDGSNLKDHVKNDAVLEAFHSAIQDEDPITKTSARFGAMALYIHVDESLERSLHTIAVRTPLMKIHTFRNPSVSAKYAAILECSDESGNQLLRGLEPPQHDRWDPARGSGGVGALSELRQFVRDGLKSRVKDQLGDSVEIDGLSRYLPSDDFSIAKGGAGRVPEPAEANADESATVHGKPGDPVVAAARARKTVRVQVRTATGSEGDQATDKGKDRGGSGRRRAAGTVGLPGLGGDGDGTARISKGDVRFRSWSEPGTDYLVVVLNSAADLEGELELVAIGAGGSAEEGYLLPIVGAELITETGSLPLGWRGNTLSTISLSANKSVRIKLILEPGHRYRLDVK